MSLISQFFLGSSPARVQLDLIEITHPNFTQTYRIVRNARRKLTTPGKFGIEVMHEGAVGPFEYEYYPAQIKPVGFTSDLSQGLAVTLGDLGNVIQKEIAAVTAANKMMIRPVVKFRTYSSADLTQPMFGPLILQISNITCSEEGNTFEAHAPRINNTRTGVLYTRDQFPMLAGFF